MLLFVDESGHDGKEMPCEVLAGVAIAEADLWNLVRAIRHAETEHFGGYLRDVYGNEIKAKKLLKRKRLKEAQRDVQISPADCVTLANSLLTKGKAARGQPTNHPTFLEIVAFSRKVLDYVHAVLDIAASFSVRVFASVVKANAPRSGNKLLRKDYVYLFERYFYFLETRPIRERGLVVFDELDKAQSHILLQQMAAYFLGTETGRYRSSRIVPEPFFVHSDLTTGVFLADLAAYILGWGWRLHSMTEPAREDLRPFADKLHEMQFHGQKPKSDGGVWALHGIVYMDDLRGQFDKP
jgi:uncharacterized protein DUF3800